MTRTPALLLVASLLALAPASAARAQTGDNPAGGLNNPPSPSAIAKEPTLLLGPSEPAPLTGELQPPPGPPPEGAAAVIKQPDCTPGNCGTPEIMAPP